MSWKEHIKEIWEESRERRKKDFREFLEMLLMMFCVGVVGICFIVSNKENTHIVANAVHEKNWWLIVLLGMGFMYSVALLALFSEKVLKSIWWIVKYVFRRIKK